MARDISWSTLTIGVVLLLCLGSTAATAAVSTSIDTAYNASQADQDQAIEVTYTITPDGDGITNLTIDFDSTANSFIASDSFSYTVTPGGADVNVQSRTGDRFFVRRLDSNEKLTFTFKIYPKTIKQRQLEVATIHLEYIQNGQEITGSERVTAELDNSPWFELQQTEQRVGSLQQKVTAMQTLMYGGAGVGVLGVVIAAGIFAWRRRSISGLKDDLKLELDQLESRLLRNGLEEEGMVHKEYKSWRRQLESQLDIPYSETFTGPEEPGGDPEPEPWEESAGGGSTPEAGEGSGGSEIESEFSDSAQDTGFDTDDDTEGFGSSDDEGFGDTDGFGERDE